MSATDHATDQLPAPTVALLSGWGRTAPTRARVVRPESFDHVAGCIRAAAGTVLARGSGCSYGDAAQNSAGDVIDVTALQAIDSFDTDAGIITAQAGVTIGQLLELTLPRGFVLPVIPGTQRVTLGGAIASDIHGKSHHRDGSLARHIASIDLCSPAGELVTLAPGNEAFNATVGGMGLTGVIVRASVRLARVPGAMLAVDTYRTRDLDETLARLEQADRSRYSVAWIDLLSTGAATGRGVVTAAEHSDLPASDAARLPRPRIGIPVRWPGGLLRPAALRAFNALYWRRAPRLEQSRPVRLGSHMFPLDAIADWNRLYGPRGLLQYQFAVPRGAERVIEQVIARLQARRVPAYLGVLKRFGAASAGMISFPIPGVTLALDLPAGAAGNDAALDDLDELVVAAGGRVYLTKDARLKPRSLAAMYPELDRWREARMGLDPGERLGSDLGRRLRLCERP
jgi:decaprenylphospho-beta-D-ribofuranose 2-oxidase